MALALVTNLTTRWCNFVTKFNPSYGVNFWVRCASGNVFIKMSSLANFTTFSLLKICLKITPANIRQQKYSLLQILKNIYLQIRAEAFYLPIHSMPMNKNYSKFEEQEIAMMVTQKKNQTPPFYVVFETVIVKTTSVK